MGSLFLQAELIEHFLAQGKVDQARGSVATLLSDFESYGLRFRSVFSALEDIAEDGDGGSDPRTCLGRALAEVGEVSAQIVYRGPSPRVAIPPLALTALCRRLTALALGAGNGAMAIVDAVEEDERCLLSLIVDGRAPSVLGEPSFDTAHGLDLRVAAEIAARYGGSFAVGTSASVLALVALPREKTR